MKYAITIFATAVIVFLAATLYYKGMPKFATPSGVSVTSTEVAQVPVVTPTPTPIDDNTVLIDTIKAALVAKHGSPAASLKVTVNKVEGDFAQGGASGEGGGGMWFAARVGGLWNLVWDGNGVIECSDIAPYPGFPSSMIPECWNTPTEKIITR